MTDNRRGSHNNLRIHPPITIGGRTFTFSGNWAEIGYGGGDQKGEATGTYKALPQLGVNEPRVLRFPNGSGMLVVGGNSIRGNGDVNTNGYSRGARHISANDIQFLQTHGIPVKDSPLLDTTVRPRADVQIPAEPTAPHRPTVVASTLPTRSGPSPTG